MLIQCTIRKPLQRDLDVLDQASFALNCNSDLFVRGLGLGGEDPGNELRRTQLHIFSFQCMLHSVASLVLYSFFFCFFFLMFYLRQKFRPFSFKSTMIQLERRMKERIGELVCCFTVRHGLCEYLHIDQVQGVGGTSL